MIVRELITRLGFQTDEQGIRHYERRVDQASDRVRRSMERANAAFSFFKGVFAGVSITGLIKVQDEIEAMRARVESMGQSTGTVFDDLREKARAGNISLAAYADGYARLATAARDVLHTQSEVTTVLDALTAGLSLSNASAAEASGVMVQFGQAMSMGVLRGQELNSLLAGAPALMQALAKEIGGPHGTVGELRKMAEQGKLTAKVVTDAMARIQPELTKQASQAPTLVSHAVQKVLDDMAVGWDEFSRRINLGGTIVSTFDGIRAGMHKMVDALGGVDQAVSIFSAALAAIGTAYVASKLPLIFAAFSNPVTLAFTAAIVALGLAFQDLWTWMRGGDSVIGGLLGSFESFKVKASGWIASLRVEVNKLFESVKNAGSAIKALISGDFNKAKDKALAAAKNIGSLTVSDGSRTGGDGSLWGHIKSFSLSNGLKTMAAGLFGTPESILAPFTGRTPVPVSAQQSKNVTINQTITAGTPNAAGEAAKRGVQEASSTLIAPGISQ